MLADPAASFSIGVPAAVAEFMRDPAEAFSPSEGGLSGRTPRGAIRLRLTGNTRPLAYEAPSRRPERWLQGLVFCLPESQARMAGRRTLSALGLDHAALAARDREAELFDLGVGAPHVDFCARTADSGLAGRLHANNGRAMADWPADLVSALIAANPHRVVRSRLGRIEVTGPIPSARTPLGPHTHLFPDKLGEIDDPAVSLPDGWVSDGWVPCLQVYPPHPQFDLAGDPIPFDESRHAAFQALLQAWGEPGYLAAKARAVAGSGEMPAADMAAEVAAEVARRQRAAQRRIP